MAFVPGFEHDIFVSYAHIDNAKMPDAEEGWVTRLINTLKLRLGAKFGRADNYSLWVDDQLAVHVNITPELIGVLEKTATLLVIYSRGYLASPWCQRERQTFLSLVKNRLATGSGVFLLEIDKLDHTERPEEFSDLLGLRFWEERNGGPPMPLGFPLPNTSHATFFSKVEDLAGKLYAELCRVKKRVEQSPQPGPATAAGAGKDEAHTSPTRGDVSDDHETVFLAEVTDDLDFLRDEVVSYVEQQGYRVVPDAWYSRDAEEFQATLERDLQQSIVFAQLLGPVAGKKPLNCEHTYVDLQFNSARAAGKPIVQWREDQLDLSRVRDPGHRQLLGGEHVLAGDIELMKSEIVNAVRAELAKREAANQPERPQTDAFVFVDTQSEDLPLAEELCGVLDMTGCCYALPVLEGSPEEVREDLEANFLDCDGLIVVYGKITSQWVREQLRQFRKVIYRRQKPLAGLAICEGPPDAKSPLGMKLKDMHVLDCRQGLDEAKIESFLAALKV